MKQRYDDGVLQHFLEEAPYTLFVTVFASLLVYAYARFVKNDNRRRAASMVDFGLGTPSFGGGASGNGNDHGEIEVLWGQNKCVRGLPG